MRPPQGGALVFTGGFLSGNMQSPVGIFLWLVVLTCTASQYLVTKKLVTLYNYPTCASWI